MLIDLGVPEEAAQLLRAHPIPGNSTDSTFLLARALTAAGQLSAARDAYRTVFGSVASTATRRGLAEYFQFELSHGTRLEAESAYARLRNLGVNADPWGRFRLALFLRHPGAAWTLPDSAGVLRLAALLAILALLPAAVVCPVHYRTLAKRLRGWSPEPGRWGLRAVWYLLGVVLIVPTLAMYVLTYDTFASVFPWFKDSYEDSYEVIGAAALGRILLWQSLAIALCAVPLLRHVDFRALLLGRASLRATIGWTVLALLLCGIMAVLYGSALQAYRRLAVLGDLTTQAIQWIQSAYGSWAALLLAALLIPAIEELLFRGILLQALSRYVSFRWAALIQAAVFAGMHQSAQAWPYVFVLGLLGAWLMRRTGGLLAPMLLHGVNNALVCGTIFAATASLNAGG